jgi:hypothetical protein
MESLQSPIYAEVYRFLISAPSPEAIIGFRASEAIQARVRELLEANREGTLTEEARIELDEFQHINHFVSMLKIYARQQIASSSGGNL